MNHHISIRGTTKDSEILRVGHFTNALPLFASLSLSYALMMHHDTNKKETIKVGQICRGVFKFWIMLSLEAWTFTALFKWCCFNKILLFKICHGKHK